MIYSRWRPDTGGYDYFESSERYGLADDLPIPRLTARSLIGVSSIVAGRAAPAGARYIGRGKSARGVVMPTSRSGLSGIPILDRVPAWGWAIAGIGVGIVLARRLG